MTYGYSSDFRDSTEASTFRNFAQRLLVSLDEKRSEQVALTECSSTSFSNAEHRKKPALLSSFATVWAE